MCYKFSSKKSILARSLHRRIDDLPVECFTAFFVDIDPHISSLPYLDFSHHSPNQPLLHQTKRARRLFFEYSAPNRHFRILFHRLAGLLRDLDRASTFLKVLMQFFVEVPDVFLIGHLFDEEIRFFNALVALLEFRIIK